MLCRCGYALVSTEASPVLPDRCPVCDGALREPEPPSPAPPQLRRDSIPGYRIEELIGRGRMGCVYRATQISLDRPVALRILPPSLSRDRAYIHSFLEQAAAASRLEHPNLVPVNERGFVAGRGYLVTELVAGPTLRERVREAGALPQRDALRAASQAAAALAYLHDRGVVHGNVKPANLMQDREGSVKLCDLGLPKHHVPPRPEAFPDPGRANLPYASPEQLGGHPPDARSDVFGLGTALYELLTGHLPFGSDDPRMILRRQTSGQVILPRQFNPGISPAIEKLVLRMIEPNPARRPATGAEVAAALRATPRLGARRHRAGSDRSTLRTVAIVAGAVLLALFACGVLLKLADSLDRGRQQPSATEPAPAKPAVQPWPERRHSDVPSGDLRRKIADSIPGLNLRGLAATWALYAANRERAMDLRLEMSKIEKEMDDLLEELDLRGEPLEVDVWRADDAVLRIDGRRLPSATQESAVAFLESVIDRLHDRPAILVVFGRAGGEAAVTIRFDERPADWKAILDRAGYRRR